MRGTRPSSDGGVAPVRSFWSGTITFGLVSIPVDLLAAVRSRQKSMRLVDEKGHPLGREYRCSQDGEKLSGDDLVRGYETESGEMVVITDEEFESMAPEMSRDIELRRFVPLEQIPPMYYQRPYYLAPAAGSVKAYHLLTKTMERTGRVAIGTFVMRGQEYLAAIIAENGVLRAQTLRYAEEIRTPEVAGLPEHRKAPAKKVNQFVRAIERLTRNELDMAELEDREAQALQTLAEAKQRKDADVIEDVRAQDEETEGGAQIIDLMEVLKKSLSKNAAVRTAERQPQRRRTQKQRPGTAPAAPDDELADASKTELYRIASDLEIPGRSKMDKSQLLQAIRRAG